MQKEYHIASSFCPHYKCGTWGFIEVGTKDVMTGQLEQGYTAYYCEVTALIKAIKHCMSITVGLDAILDDIIIRSRNQSLCARFQREWENMWQINYARKPPWDQMPQLLRELPAKPIVTWWIDPDSLDASFIRGEVVDQLSLCRDALVERISNELNSVN